MAVDLTDRSWLADLCGGEERPSIAQPGAVVVREQPYLCATNGHALLLVAGAFDNPPHEHEGQIRGMLTALPPATTTFALADLRAFLGPYASPVPPTCPACQGTRVVRCGECDGTGATECECPRCDHVHQASCEGCDGARTVDCECQDLAASAVDPFVLGGVTFNRPLVARYIRHLPDGDVQAAFVPVAGDVGRASALFGDGWILLLMPLRTARESAPVFPLPQAEAAA